jgi:hypothetical protein
MNSLIFFAGAGLQTAKSRFNVSDGVANPVQQREFFAGAGLQPAPPLRGGHVLKSSRCTAKGRNDKKMTSFYDLAKVLALEKGLYF